MCLETPPSQSREPLYSYFISAKIYKTFLIKKFVSNKILYIFVPNKINKTIKIMKALVTVNQKSVGIFYQMPSAKTGMGETQTEMHQRVLDIITHRYGACNLNIEWL